MTPKSCVDQGRRYVYPGQGITVGFFAKVRLASSNLVARSVESWSAACSQLGARLQDWLVHHLVIITLIRLFDGSARREKGRMAEIFIGGHNWRLREGFPLGQLENELQQAMSRKEPMWVALDDGMLIINGAQLDSVVIRDESYREKHKAQR
jgi:hypothetical protein